MASANRNGYDLPLRGGIRQNDVQMFLCIIFVCNHKCVAEIAFIRLRVLTCTLLKRSCQFVVLV